jgi:glycosyltransferase involved in cell wall biosynthesis
MKILIVTGIYPPDIGGPATYVKTIEERLLSSGHDVSVLTFGEVRSLPKVIRHVVFLFKCFRGAYKKDIVFAQDPVSVGLPAMVAAKVLRKKFFLRLGGDYAWEQGVLRYNIHETLDEFVVSKKTYPLFLMLARGIERIVARAAIAVAVQSSYMKGIISYWNISPSKITVIPNSFSGKVLNTEKGFLREHLGMTGRIIISAGRMVPWKKFDELIKVIPTLLKDVPDLRLYLAGDGPEETKLKKLVAEHNLHTHVTFLGRVTKERLIEYLAAADVFVLNSTYEGFSHQILEAYAAGVPVIATNVCGNPEAVDNGESGLLIHPHDKTDLQRAIMDILKNPTYADTLAQGGKKKLDQFSTDRMMDGTNIFLGIIKTGRVE